MCVLPSRDDLGPSCPTDKGDENLRLPCGRNKSNDTSYPSASLKSPSSQRITTTMDKFMSRWKTRVVIPLIFLSFPCYYYYKSSDVSLATSPALSALETDNQHNQHNRHSTPPSITPMVQCDCHPNYQTKCQRYAHQYPMLGQNVTIPEFWNHAPCTHLMTGNHSNHSDHTQHSQHTQHTQHIQHTPNVLFLHAGKGGGGTIKITLQQHRIAVDSAHPTLGQTFTQRLEHGEFDTLILNVRDPVDRWVSAFRWRWLVLQERLSERLQEGEDRLEQLEGGTSRSPISEKAKIEADMLERKYGADPNVLAEGLCKNSPIWEEASKDVRKIGHADPLVRWMRHFVDPEKIDSRDNYGVQKFMVVPLKKQEGGDTAAFERQLEELSLELLRQKYGMDVARMIMEQKPESLGQNSYLKEMKQHSSSKYFNETDSSPLSPLGECCMTRFFEDDYRLIRSMISLEDDFNSSIADSDLGVVPPLEGVHPIIGSACGWGSQDQQNLCRSDLITILERRSHYLDQSQGSCSDIYQ